MLRNFLRANRHPHGTCQNFRLCQAAPPGFNAGSAPILLTRPPRTRQVLSNKGPATASKVLRANCRHSPAQSKGVVPWGPKPAMCSCPRSQILKQPATAPPRCASRPASSGNASKMPYPDRPKRSAKHALVDGSLWTFATAERRNSSTSPSLPDLDSNRTINPWDIMVPPFALLGHRTALTSPWFHYTEIAHPLQFSRSHCEAEGFRVAVTASPSGGLAGRESPFAPSNEKI